MQNEAQEEPAKEESSKRLFQRNCQREKLKRVDQDPGLFLTADRNRLKKIEAKNKNKMC